MTIFKQLPMDLVEEILCRVPATSLKRLQSTCKELNLLFKHDSRFARKHSYKAPKESMVLMLTNQSMICPVSVNLHGAVPSLEVKSELSPPDWLYNNSRAQFEISQVFHCDCLLLCTTLDESRIMVWNPCTGETKCIKAGSNKPATYVLGYYQDSKSSSKSYKILRFFNDDKYSEIYEFSSDSWRILDRDIDPGWKIGYSDQCVSFNGNAYWFARNKTKTHLLRFDFSTEKHSRRVPLPYKRHRFEKANLSIVREEKLLVLLQCEVYCETEIWVTDKIDETKVVSWNKILEFNLRTARVRVWCHGSFLVDEEKKVVVCCQRWIDYDDGLRCEDYIVREDNEVTRVTVGVDKMYTCWPAILNYVPSLVQIERQMKEKVVTK